MYLLFIPNNIPSGVIKTGARTLLIYILLSSKWEKFRKLENKAVITSINYSTLVLWIPEYTGFNFVCTNLHYIAYRRVDKEHNSNNFTAEQVIFCFNDNDKFNKLEEPGKVGKDSNK